jgi:hypothetical protein
MAHRHHCHNHPPPLEQCLCRIPCATPWKLRSSASRHDCHLSRRPAPQCRNTSMQLPTDVLPLPVTTNQPPRALLTPPHSVHMSLVAWHCTAAAPYHSRENSEREGRIHVISIKGRHLAHLVYVAAGFGHERHESGLDGATAAHSLAPLPSTFAPGRRGGR